MKRYVTRVNSKGEKYKKQVSFIPFRYILAILFSVLETAAILTIVIILTIFIPFFWITVILTQIGVVLAIFNSDDNPEYKLPWLLVVLIFPIVGFMLYFLFYKRKLSKKYIKRLQKLQNINSYVDDNALEKLKEEDLAAYNNVSLLNRISSSHLYNHTLTKYFSSGEDAMKSMLDNLMNAKSFIFLEYFIIEEGVFWNSILTILKEKAKEGIEIKVIFDDIGCMMTLPGDYSKELKIFGIDATPFAKLRGQADSEFNNRCHRKILVIDGFIGYTGGINLADEYINKLEKFGHWKYAAIRLEGDAVFELSKLFLSDFYLNKKIMNNDADKYFKKEKASSDGFVVPFGDGPSPIYQHRVSKVMILNMLYQANRYVYITTPYLIIDNELKMSLINSALKGIDIRIITPHIPDKRLIFSMTRSAYKELMKAGVKIFEYKPGFIHAKMYISDDQTAIIGTINMDYRSLVHHFENGVWLYKNSSIVDMKEDFILTMNQSIFINENPIRDKWYGNLIRLFVKVFSPLL